MKGNYKLDVDEYLRLLEDGPPQTQQSSEKPLLAQTDRASPPPKKALQPSAGIGTGSSLLGGLLGPRFLAAADACSLAKDDLHTLEDVDWDFSQALYWSDPEPEVYRDLSPDANAGLRCPLLPGPVKAHSHGLKDRPRADPHKIQAFVMQDLSSELDSTVAKLLSRLQTMHDRDVALRSPQGGVKRRFVVGSSAVGKQVKKSIPRCIIIAPDVDTQERGLEQYFCELLPHCYQNKVPVIFALSRNCLGAFLRRGTCCVSTVAILNATGAESLLEQSMSLADDHREQWLSRRK